LPASVDDVRIAVADSLKLPGPEALQEHWRGTCSAALASAESDVRTALLDRGFSLEQIAAWPALDAWTRDQALYWALVRGAGTEAFDDKFVKLLDRREALTTVIVTGPDPEGREVVTAGGGVGHGEMKSRRETFRDEFGEWRKW
jgi:hypothetical protein